MQKDGRSRNGSRPSVIPGRLVFIPGIILVSFNDPEASPFSLCGSAPPRPLLGLGPGIRRGGREQAAKAGRREFIQQKNRSEDNDREQEGAR